MHEAYIAKLKNVRPHPNADRLQLAEVFGCTVCVDLSYKENMLGVYFQTDLQLSEEFCTVNDLVRRKDENGNPAGGYLEPGKRNVRTVQLRGEPSDGLFLPLSCIEYTGVKTEFLREGDKFSVLNGHEICQKYIPRGKNKKPAQQKEGNHTRKKHFPIAPLFVEHADTQQLAYNLADFREGDLVEITLKMHGTSARTGYLPILKYEKRSLIDRILRRPATPIYEWGYVTGTRRTICGSDYEGGFYGSNQFRKGPAEFFEGKLRKSEQIYYEVVGFLEDGTPIMPSVGNSKIQDKEFTKRYGKMTTFSYGCESKECDFYVYRMTITNEDGDIIEYPPDYVRYRCEQMGCKYVPLLWRGFIPHIPQSISNGSPGNWIKEVAETLYDGPDPIGKTHVREGVVVRIVNRPKFTAYKHKNFSFKCLSGIAVDAISDPDSLPEGVLEEI